MPKATYKIENDVYTVLDREFRVMDYVRGGTFSYRILGFDSRGVHAALCDVLPITISHGQFRIEIHKAIKNKSLKIIKYEPYEEEEE